jgi:hypothetical protein
MNMPTPPAKAIEAAQKLSNSLVEENKRQRLRVAKKTLRNELADSYQEEFVRGDRMAKDGDGSLYVEDSIEFMEREGRKEAMASLSTSPLDEYC